MMLVIALGASISFSSCGSDDDDDVPGGGGSTTSGGGASATSVPGSYTGITGSDTEKLTAIFAEDGTGIINENSEQYSFTYSMGGETGIVKVKEGYSTYTYTIKFIDGFMLLEESDGDISYIFYKSGQNLGSPNAKKFIGSWENKIVGSKSTYIVNFTFNSDGTLNWSESETYPGYPEKNYENKETFTYKMVNAYVARFTEYEEVKDRYYYYTAVVLNNKIYIGNGGARSAWILSKK